MPVCTRKGCGQVYGSDSAKATCIHHPGTPVFHEGLKSWSCCVDVNKPVLEFDDFMAIQGCSSVDGHTDEIPKEVLKATPTTTFTTLDTTRGREVYTSMPLSKQTFAPAQVAQPAVDEDDDMSVNIDPGTKCRRVGCNIVFVNNETNRLGDGEGTVCSYHSAPPIFREGSKGYLCCKRRVLEFEEFLKIAGCRKGRHLFSPPVTKDIAEVMTDCRVDHYQTVDKVHVSIFAKKVDKERSTVKFGETQITVDLYLPGSKRFLRVIDLFGPINPAESVSQFFGTKVELHLQKSDTRSWVVLEKTTQNLGNIALTFGVGGRTGTVGAKDVILDETNKVRG
ncbi:HSP20-like chaperone [Collybia nuda]|uniref:HSP20-like chaperone n=1 Tax=Collybia nuda TaxID=64659 RepID=A0A9P5XW22_9AGAR|nr:HSP20-like chaperone [Collybia nuda]